MTEHSRRSCLIILVLAIGPAHSSSAQASGWSLGVVAGYSDFRGGVRDADGVTIEPSSRLEFGLSVARGFDAWQLEADVKWAPGHFSSRDSTGQTLQIDLLGESFPQLRLAPLIGRRLAAIGEGRVALLLGPTFDLWHADDRLRPRLGGQLRLALEAPVGGLLVQNFVAYSISGSPFDASELPPDVIRSTLQAFSLGVAIRLRL